MTPMGIVIQRWLAAVTHPIEIGKHVGGGSTQILPPHDRPRRRLPGPGSIARAWRFLAPLIFAGEHSAILLVAAEDTSTTSFIWAGSKACRKSIPILGGIEACLDRL